MKSWAHDGCRKKLPKLNPQIMHINSIKTIFRDCLETLIKFRRRNIVKTFLNISKEYRYLRYTDVRFWLKFLPKQTGVDGPYFYNKSKLGLIMVRSIKT